MRRWTGWIVMAVLGLVLLVPDAVDARDERPGPRPLDFKELAMKSGDDDDDDSDSERGRRFQVAFVSRVDTDFFQADGTAELLGFAESLQAPMPGVVLGRFKETIGTLCRDVDLPECPTPGACVPICDTVNTPRGSLTYQAYVMVLPGSDSGPFSTSSIYGEIVGGTRSYRGATGDVTLAGQINVCTTPGDGKGCAVSDGVPEGLGLRYDCNFILRGVRDH